MLFNRQRRASRLVDLLVRRAQTLAIASMTRFMDDFPSVNEVLASKGVAAGDHWDFVMTTAAVRTGYFMASGALDERQLKTLDRLMPERVAEIGGSANEAVLDFLHTAQRAPPEIPPHLVAGTWVMLNLRETRIQGEDRSAAEAIGHFLTSGMVNWWK